MGSQRIGLHWVHTHHTQSWSKVKWSRLVVSDFLLPHGLELTRLLRPWNFSGKSTGVGCHFLLQGIFPTQGSNSCPLSLWHHPTISSSVIPFSSYLQSFPAIGSVQMSQFFALGDQSIGVSTSESVLPMNIQDWFPLGWTGWISLTLSRVFSNTTVQTHQFFRAQLSL